MKYIAIDIATRATKTFVQAGAAALVMPAVGLPGLSAVRIAAIAGLAAAASVIQNGVKEAVIAHRDYDFCPCVRDEVGGV